MGPRHSRHGRYGDLIGVRSSPDLVGTDADNGVLGRVLRPAYPCMRGGEMSSYLLIPMLVGVALFGWVAGMWTHRRAERWCTSCGLELTCGPCQRAEVRPLVAREMRS